MPTDGLQYFNTYGIWFDSWGVSPRLVVPRVINGLALSGDSGDGSTESAQMEVVPIAWDFPGMAITLGVQANACDASPACVRSARGPKKRECDADPEFSHQVWCA